MSAQDAEKAGLVSKVFPVNELVSTSLTDNRVSVMTYVLLVSMCTCVHHLCIHCCIQKSMQTHVYKGCSKTNHPACLANQM